MQNFPAIDWTRILFWQWGIRHIGSCGAQDFLPLADRRKILDDAVRAECEDGVSPWRATRNGDANNSVVVSDAAAICQLFCNQEHVTHLPTQGGGIFIFVAIVNKISCQ